ncbi:MAG: hypothetical protein ABI673_03980 [Novosphingobium sp.]
MIRFTMRKVTRAALLGGLAVLSACGPTAPPPAPLPPPPPPPVVLVIPPAPRAPNRASPNLVTPPVNADGLRYSVNRNISPSQMTWNLRAAYNVAALNCNDPKYAEIVPGYRLFLKVHAKGLAAANKQVDAEFRGKYGVKFIPPREKYMTEVYNHFATPPTLKNFCDAAMAVSRDASAVKPADLQAFSALNLPNIEVVFDDFYRRYDQYKADLAAWNALYAPPVAVQPPAAPLQPVATVK